MNIDDASNASEIADDQVFPNIFSRQLELARKYGPIEKKNGFFHPDVDRPGHLDDPKLQHWVKDMFWRTTEEIAEAFEDLEIAFQSEISWRDQWNHNAALRHVYEEIADALHFLTEVSVILKFNPELVQSAWTICEVQGPAMPSWLLATGGRTIIQLGLAANCLKNKPWKSTHMTTDINTFYGKLTKVWMTFIELLKGLDLNLQDVYNLYHKKNAVNQFRQRSNY